MHVTLATGNTHKATEMQTLLQSSMTIHTPPRAIAVAETGTSFVENALIKAHAYAHTFGTTTIADDSGLCVPALGNAPGIYSARYARKNADDAANRARLLAACKDITDRRAFFVCVLVFLRTANDPLPIIAEGRVWGTIAVSERGTNGFGYDPVFVLPNGMTFGEIDHTEKNALSHRAQAARALLRAIDTETQSRHVD